MSDLDAKTETLPKANTVYNAQSDATPTNVTQPDSVSAPTSHPSALLDSVLGGTLTSIATAVSAAITNEIREIEKREHGQIQATNLPQQEQAQTHAQVSPTSWAETAMIAFGVDEQKVASMLDEPVPDSMRNFFTRIDQVMFQQALSKLMMQLTGQPVTQDAVTPSLAMLGEMFRTSNTFRDICQALPNAIRANKSGPSSSPTTSVTSSVSSLETTPISTSYASVPTTTTTSPSTPSVDSDCVVNSASTSETSDLYS